MDPVALLKFVRENVPAETKENLNVREELLAEARKLMLSLERTDNSVERVSFQVRVLTSVCVRTEPDRTFQALGDNCLQNCRRCWHFQNSG